jgi:hypothetical protein
MAGMNILMASGDFSRPLVQGTQMLKLAMDYWVSNACNFATTTTGK